MADISKSLAQGQANTGEAAFAKGAAVTAPTGGATIDAEARTAINALITRLEELGVLVAN